MSLAVDLGSRRPLTRGARVMAAGYKNITGQRGSLKGNRLVVPFREEMWGSVGQVVELYPEKGPGHNRWPTVEFDCDWPGGMSGGPIFDEDGFVVGIVSRSGFGRGHGVWLQAIDPRADPLTILHPTWPGWVRVYAAFDGDMLLCSSPDRAEVEARVAGVALDVAIELIAQNANTHQYVRADGVVRSAALQRQR